MCLAVPGKILSIEDQVGTVDVAGVRVDTRLDFIDDPAVDDYVLLHAGFAISKLSPEDAQETLALLGEAGVVG